MSTGDDSPQEMACLDRAKIWEGLIGWCEELERGEIKAKVGRSVRDPAVMMSTFPEPGGMAALKRPKTRKFKAGGYDPKGELLEVGVANHPLVSVDEVRVNGVQATILEEKLDKGKVVIAVPRPTWDKKTMSRAVARDLGLI